MATYSVHVTIENKPGISDPEGETILNDLVLKGTHKAVSKIKTAKMLKFTIKEKDKKTAQSKIQEICDKFKIFPKDICHVGDNENDIKCFEKVGLGIAYDPKTEKTEEQRAAGAGKVLHQFE